MGVNQHRKEAPKNVKCMIVTVSDSRTKATDKSGKLIIDLLKEAGYEVTDYQITKDEYTSIREMVRGADNRSDIEAIIFNGGTGITLRDTTYEAVSSMLDKTIPGFGELFRFLSFRDDIGAAAMLSRAVAGVRGKTAVFSIPGSSGAVKLATEQLIIPELTHVMREIYKNEATS
ncbi:MogA/MoaB family molybdenum cofactor biosynthesis protein [Texcoconibacillus texcoconensis]|uniref:Molybdenum cofactor biosynthesis protein B n=1 Tax=Texcoconibacillus texcoconensis TaxID=1095777 RepID=A0A840QNJ3_9BACI|nr:MogA/MoaB family molybdenum cofactor biosynthesis protein [Texcoconibacillus texcoconensis]MBB5172945.1 molybdenum cofactor biosynthesis protein B [Texcoconibacillus texcoconensis]